MASPAIIAGTDIVRDEIFITDATEGVRTISVSTSIPPTMARPGPWRVEDFDLHKELYRGKTSLLYMATDKRSGLQVALKLYRKRKLSTLNKYQVEREIRIHIKLDHVNIIKLYVAFEDEKNVYMVQEFAGGGDLFEDLKRNGGSIKEKYTVRDIIVPFLNALTYLHGLGIIHRDIKPENILLTSQKIVKIADFGLSISHLQERPVTRAGTLDYMAPEVLICPDKRRPEENKEKVLLVYSPQVDAWAVGILCFELMAGYPPFEQESRAATYEHIMYKEPKFPAWMSADAKAFITTALTKNATQRSTIADLAKQPLILTYAKPVEPPVSPTATSPAVRLHADILVERSQRSVVLPMQPCCLQLARTGSKRPGHADSSDDAGNSLGGSSMGENCSLAMARSPSGFAITAKPLPSRLSSISLASNQPLQHPGDGLGSSSGSHLNKATVGGMAVDEDASYSVSDFQLLSDEDGSKAASISQKNALEMRRQASISSPLTKSRLGCGVALQSPHQATTFLSQGKVSNGPFVKALTSELVTGVEASSSSYYKPQNGILSDDAAVPLAHKNSSSLSGGGSGLRSPVGSAHTLGARPTLDKLLPTALTPADDKSEDRGSKYTKLFAKMWGGGSSSTKASDEEAFGVDAHVTPAGSHQHKSSSPSVSKAKSAVRSLQDEVLVDRQESLLVVNRNGSVIGAPTMNFKRPQAVAVGFNSLAAHSGGLGLTSPTAAAQLEARYALLNGLRSPGLVDDLAMPGRTNSDAMIGRAGLDRELAGRSFSSAANSPAMVKKLASAPLVSKIEAYVQQHQQDRL